MVRGIRPEDLDIVASGEGPIAGRLYALELTGESTLATLREGSTSICARGPADYEAAIDARCSLAPRPGARIHLFDKETGRRLAV